MTTARLHIILVCCCALLSSPSTAQNLDTGSIFSQPVAMDTFVVRSGFDINAFIRRVRNDTTFYKAFRSMHLVPYSATNNIVIFGKQRSDTLASEYSITKQHRSARCRVSQYLQRHTRGNYHKRNGELNYYTSQLFESLFFSQDSVCNENDIVAGNLVQQDGGAIEVSKYRLKQLIFNPGARIHGIPFVADRASIFDPEEAQKYDFHVSLKDYNGEPCYIFRITPKKGFEKKVIYNNLTTWFRKSDYSILARDYSLSYRTLVYDFNVAMSIRTSVIGNKIFPTHIGYDGNWHIFTKKRERAHFTALITY